MKSQGSSVCSYGDEIYPHGSDVCMNGKCMVCNQGEWNERIDFCTRSETSSGTSE